MRSAPNIYHRISILDRVSRGKGNNFDDAFDSKVHMNKDAFLSSRPNLPRTPSSNRKVVPKQIDAYGNCSVASDVSLDQRFFKKTISTDNTAPTSDESISVGTESYENICPSPIAEPIRPSPGIQNADSSWSLEKTSSRRVRNGSPFHERLAVTNTKAMAMRRLSEQMEYEEKQKNKGKPPKKPFYLVAGKSSSPTSQKPKKGTRKPPQASLNAKSQSFSRSQSFSSEKSARPTQRRSIGCNSPFHERLAVTNTKTMAMRRYEEQLEKEEKYRQRSGSVKNRPFYLITGKDNTPKKSPRTTMRRASPLPPKIVKTTPTSKRQMVRPPAFAKKEKSRQSTPKRSERETRAFYDRLARHDTVSSSKKIITSRDRPMLLTQIELMELEKEKTRVQKEKQMKKRTSKDFFEILSKDSTLSNLYRCDSSSVARNDDSSIFRDEGSYMGNSCYDSFDNEFDQI
ncbi:predicted protein [Chaetoceros tenuissimus]|uniref:Uncharacterized protein n=1 Tax=Chaetoceros tenuissimus TaxID=426638 RepID=A0AAD3CPQ7_9STRA|nr:predicted protein [Chaetoceros tenuissimus]